MLNDPVGFEDRAEEEWTTAIGLRRGLWAGLYISLIMAVLLALLARYAPAMALMFWLRVPLAFGVAYVLCCTVERAAGMSDVRCVLLALGLAGLVLVSNHLALALAVNLPIEALDSSWMFPLNVVSTHFSDGPGTLDGADWLHPYMLIAVSIAPLTLAGIFLAALKRR